MIRNVGLSVLRGFFADLRSPRRPGDAGELAALGWSSASVVLGERAAVGVVRGLGGGAQRQVMRLVGVRRRARARPRGSRRARPVRAAWRVSSSSTARAAMSASAPGPRCAVGAHLAERDQLGQRVAAEPGGDRGPATAGERHLGGRRARTRARRGSRRGRRQRNVEALEAVLEGVRRPAGWLRQPARIALSRMRASAGGAVGLAGEERARGRAPTGRRPARRRRGAAAGRRAGAAARRRREEGGAAGADLALPVGAERRGRRCGRGGRAAGRRAPARRSGLSSTWPSVSRVQIRSTIGREASRSALHRRARRRRGRRRRGPGRPASARSAARGRGRAAAGRGRSAGGRRRGRRASPSSATTGSGASFQSAASWASVIAVPSGGDGVVEAGLGERDHVHVALGRRSPCRPCAAAARAGPRL